MGQLTASISHEVNQPLCAIVTNAQAPLRLLTRESFDLAEAREALQDICQAGQRASAVVTRIRSFLQKTPVQRSPLDINAVVREVATLMRADLARRGVPVKLELAEMLPTVLGDRIELQQVMLNLMANGADAVDHVTGAERELVVRTGREAAGTVTVAVSDSGVGIGPDQMGRVFEPFFTTKPGNLGVGLAICKSIVEAHGGQITVRPNTGPGATFQFTVPTAPEGAR